MQDVFFDDESAEVVISSLRLGEEHDRYSNQSTVSLLFSCNYIVLNFLLSFRSFF